MSVEAWWEPAPRPLRLAGDEVHVWRAHQDAPPVPHAVLAQTLSDAERARAHRFVMPRLTQRFIVAHAFTRDVLGAYLGRPPATLHLEVSAMGKPYLPDSELAFNLTHSGHMAVLAVAWREVGVDVEQIRADVLRDRLAERFFSACEVTALEELPPEQRAEGFFNCWTRKEAYVKALGAGLRIPLDRFDVTLAPADPPRLLADRGNADLAQWGMAAFTPGHDYRGAVVAQGHGWRLRGFDWREPL